MKQITLQLFLFLSVLMQAQNTRDTVFLDESLVSAFNSTNYRSIKPKGKKNKKSIGFQGNGFILSSLKKVESDIKLKGVKIKFKKTNREYDCQNKSFVKLYLFNSKGSKPKKIIYQQVLELDLGEVSNHWLFDLRKSKLILKQGMEYFVGLNLMIGESCSNSENNYRLPIVLTKIKNSFSGVMSQNFEGFNIIKEKNKSFSIDYEFVLCEKLTATNTV